MAAAAVTFAGSSKLPNVLICGTPGTGKTTTAAAVAARSGLTHVCVGAMRRCARYICNTIRSEAARIGMQIQEKGFHAELNEEFDSYVLDEESEDRLLDELEPIIARGGAVVDFHSVDFFPERFFHLVVVLRADNTVLYDRLAARGYRENKISENVTAEIMQVVLEEARESYRPEIVQELRSDSLEDLESNVARIDAWVKAWQRDNP